MVRPRQFTDTDLLDTARACFLEHGPGVSTAVIAEEAGVSQATLFKRFGTKKQLMLRALLPDHEGSQWQALTRPLDARPMLDQLLEKGQIMVSFFNVLQPCIGMLLASGSNVLEELHAEGHTPPPVRVLRSMQAFFDQAIAEGRMRPVGTEALALAWIGALRNRAFFAHAMPNLHLESDDATYVRELTEMLWQGIQPAEEAR